MSTETAKARVKETAILLMAIAAVVVGRECFPKERIVHTAPEIVTRWDTLEVTQLDTVEVMRWRDRWRTRTDTFEIVREVLVTQVDTVYELAPTIGVSALDTRLAWGDSMIVRGFELEGDPAGILRREWRANYFVTGPLRSIIADTIPPRVEFWPPPERRCSCFWSNVKWFGYGNLTGRASCAIF